MQMNITKKTPSIEFFVDEDADLLLAYEHPLEKPGNDHPEEILSLPLDNIRGREPAEIQRTLGRLVLAFLNSRSSKGLNFPRDTDDEKKLDFRHANSPQAASKSDAEESKFDLAVELISRGMSCNCWPDIEQGEHLLNQAIAEGIPEAIKYQSEVWALVRPRLELKFKGP